MGSRRAFDLDRTGSLHADAAAQQQAYMDRAKRRARRGRQSVEQLQPAARAEESIEPDDEDFQTGPPDDPGLLNNQRFVPHRDRSTDALNFENNLRTSAAYWQDLAVTQLPAWAEQQGSPSVRHMQEMQHMLDKFCQMPLHRCTDGQISSQHACATGTDRPIIVYGLGYSFELRIPGFSCSKGCPNFEVPPVYLRCMGSTPLRPGSMFDISLLQLFHSLRWRAGASASAMTSSLEDVLKAVDLLGMGPVARRMDDKAFLSAYRQYRMTFR